MSSKKQPERYTEMNAEEQAKATAQFDEEFVIDSSVEPTPRQKAQWQRARRKRGRPKVGKGVKIVSVSLEKGLLARTDRLARKLKIQRTKLIARGLEAILNHEISVGQR